MSTYLLHEGRLFLAESTDAWHPECESESWLLEGGEAIRQHRFRLREVRGPMTVSVYGTCKACDPVLVRTAEPGLFGDIVNEHAVFVDFRLTLGLKEPLRVERTSGTRDELKADLRRRGVYVLEDDDPLAVAHRELKKVRERLHLEKPGRRRSWS